MTITEAPPRPAPSHDPDGPRSGDTTTIATHPPSTRPPSKRPPSTRPPRFEPPVPEATPRPATPPDATRPGCIGAVTTVARSVPVVEPEEVVDPRIAARRADVEDEADRTRLRPILAILGVLVTAVVVLAVLWSPLFSVNRITLDGATAAQRRSILAAANIQRGTPLVTVDVAAARARVAALPIVEGVRVSRVWPRAVVITVALRTPIASIHIAGAGGLAVVDAQGTVVATTPSEDPSFDPQSAALPVIESTSKRTLLPGATIGAADRRALRSLDALSPELRARVREVHRDRAGVRLRLVGAGRFADVTVVLGQPNDLAAKALALQSVLSQDDSEGISITDIDVSVPDAPILTERQ